MTTAVLAIGTEGPRGRSISRKIQPVAGQAAGSVFSADGVAGGQQVAKPSWWQTWRQTGYHTTGKGAAWFYGGITAGAIFLGGGATLGALPLALAAGLGVGAYVYGIATLIRSMD